MYWAYRPEREGRRKSRLIKSPAARRIGNSTNPAPKASGLTNLDEKRGYLDIFVRGADKQENPIARAGMLLNVVNTLPNSGQLERAKAQLESVRSLLSFSLAHNSDHRYPDTVVT